MKIGKKVLISGILFMSCCGGIISSKLVNVQTDYSVSEKQNREILQLNRLAKCADDTQIENISIENDNKKLFGKKRVAYSVESQEYSENDIERIAEGLHTKVKEDNKNEEEHIYKLTNNGVLVYYEGSGSITYMIDDIAKGGNINEEKCVQVAKQFLDTSKIITSEELHLANVEVGCSAETNDGEKILSYQITFMKNSPEGVDGYAGVGPGICIDVDAEYNITGFVSVNKNITELSDEYDTLTLSEAEDAMTNNEEVQIMTDGDGEVDSTLNDVTIDDVKVCLYSDPATVEQQYMAPYYVMTGTDDSGTSVEVTIPAVEESEIKIK